MGIVYPEEQENRNHICLQETEPIGTGKNNSQSQENLNQQAGSRHWRKSTPTRPYRKDSEQKDGILKKPGPVPITKIQRISMVLAIFSIGVGKTNRVAADLKACFPDRYKMILSVACI